MQISQRLAGRRIHMARGSRGNSFDCVKRRLISLLITAITALYAQQTPTAYSAYDHAKVADNKELRPIHLVLSTSKRRLRVGEPIEVIGYLENRGETPYYVGNALAGFFGTTGLHQLELRIFDAKNKEVWIGRGGGSWIWKYGTTTKEKLASAYTQLQPGTIFGVKEDIPVRLPAGRYRLTATYREMEALSWTDEERRALSIPVWTQPLDSNTVMITILH